MRQIPLQFRSREVALAVPIWQKPPRNQRSVGASPQALDQMECCGSSAVEHTLGKGEVESSILSRSTIRSRMMLCSKTRLSRLQCADAAKVCCGTKIFDKSNLEARLIRGRICSSLAQRSR